MVDRKHSDSISEYEILKTLGTGAYGIVNLCWNKNSKQLVAIKQLNK